MGKLTSTRPGGDSVEPGHRLAIYCPFLCPLHHVRTPHNLAASPRWPETRFGLAAVPPPWPEDLAKIGPECASEVVAREPVQTRPHGRRRRGGERGGAIPEPACLRRRPSHLSHSLNNMMGCTLHGKSSSNLADRRRGDDEGPSGSNDHVQRYF